MLRLQPAGGLAVDAGRVVDQARGRAAQPERLLGVGDRLPVPAQQGAGGGPAVVGEAVARVAPEHLVEVAQGRLGGPASQVRLPPVQEQGGVGRREPQRQREVVGGAAVVAELDPGQGAGLVDAGRGDAAVLQAAVERLHGLRVALQAQEGFRAPAVGGRVPRAGFEGRVVGGQGLRVTPGPVQDVAALQVRLASGGAARGLQHRGPLQVPHRPGSVLPLAPQPGPLAVEQGQGVRVQVLRLDQGPGGGDGLVELLHGRGRLPLPGVGRRGQAFAQLPRAGGSRPQDISRAGGTPRQL
jgi:hypothetical protein